jgi:hypothetical protein
MVRRRFVKLVIFAAKTGEQSKVEPPNFIVSLNNRVGVCHGNRA